MKRLLIVTGIYPPDIGGPASYVPRIARALTTRGWAVKVVTTSEVGPQPGDDAPYPVIRIPRRPAGLHRAVRLAGALRRHGGEADVWLVQGMPLVAAAVGALMGKPLVHKIVGDWAWERARLRGWYAGSLDDFQVERRSPRLQLLRWIRNAPLRGAAAIFTPSAYLARIVEGWRVARRPVGIVLNAVETPPPAAEAARAAFTVVTVCRLAPWKGVDGLIRAVARLPGVELVVVGDGPERDRLEAEAERAGVSARIRWTGHVASAAVAPLLRNADVFVLNSSYEGLPHVVLEAFAQETAVVATRAGGTPEVVRDGETGLLAPVADDEALAAAIARLQSDLKLRRRLAAGGRRLLDEDFAFDRMVAGVERILLESCGAP